MVRDVRYLLVATQTNTTFKIVSIFSDIIVKYFNGSADGNSSSFPILQRQSERNPTLILPYNAKKQYVRISILP